MKQLAYIGFGGALGAILRYWMVEGVHLFLGRHFPVGTLMVNLLGSFVLGFFSIFVLEHMVISLALRNAIIIGFLGAFTTFSTFSVDTMNLIELGHSFLALLNIFLSVLGCLVAAWVGLYLGRQF